MLNYCKRDKKAVLSQGNCVIQCVTFRAPLELEFLDDSWCRWCCFATW